MFGREIIRQLDLQTYLRVHLVELRVILAKKYHQDDERETLKAYAQTDTQTHVNKTGYDRFQGLLSVK